MEHGRSPAGNAGDASASPQVPAAYSDASAIPAGAAVARKGPLWRTVDALVLCGIAGMLVVVALQVTSRVQLHSIPWTEEVTRYLFIWTVFLGLASGFRSAEHTRITMALRVLPRGIRRLMVHVYFAAGVLFFGLVAYTGWNLVTQQFRSGESSPALGLGMFTVTSAVVAGAVLSIIAHFETVYRDGETRRLLDEEEAAG